MLAVPSAEGWYLVAKRLLDVTLALVLLVVLAPLLVLIAVAIVLDSRGPVIFRQQRVQGDQRPGTPQPEGQQFAFFKFRTMHHRCDQRLHQEYVTQLINGHAQVQAAGGQGLYKLAQDSRITRVGPCQAK
jgi:lipopolysaccharide/colanic/teichoic acid biosynthesis glycosyltransferase